jgi:hypothetical protein
MDRLSRWGVGPSTALAALPYAAVAGIFTRLWPEVCLIHAIPYPVSLILGGLLLAIGVPMLIVAATALTRNYDRDELATTGVYGLVRNPIYSAWILFLLLGLALLCRSWPIHLTGQVPQHPERSKRNAVATATTSRTLIPDMCPTSHRVDGTRAHMGYGNDSRQTGP